MPPDFRPDAVPAPDIPASHPPLQPGLAELFLAFAKMSLAGFGGVLVWARRGIVEQHRWMTAEEFNETFALCHFLPGPNIVNLSERAANLTRQLLAFARKPTLVRERTSLPELLRTTAELVTRTLQQQVDLDPNSADTVCSSSSSGASSGGSSVLVVAPRSVVSGSSRIRSRADHFS